MFTCLTRSALSSLKFCLLEMPWLIFCKAAVFYSFLMLSKFYLFSKFHAEPTCFQFSRHNTGLKLLFFTCLPGIIVVCREVDLSLLHTVALRSWSPLILCLSALSVVPSIERDHICLYSANPHLFIWLQELSGDRGRQETHSNMLRAQIQGEQRRWTQCSCFQEIALPLECRALCLACVCSVSPYFL